MIINIQELGFKLYLLFIISWFLHIGARVPFLGSIRPDLVLVFIITLLIILGVKRDDANRIQTGTDKWIKILIIYIIITIPLTQWPGSVVRYGLINFTKGVVFYFFTVYFVNSEKRLKLFLGTFLACQSFRIIEPLYLHITEGYWGSAAFMANLEFMDRLGGAPYDIINPNGLAYVIVSVIPFFYYLTTLNWKNKFLFLLAVPIFLYALALTASRSGFVALLVVYAGIVLKSKKRLLLAILGVVVAVILFARLSPDLQDRYLSIIDPTTQHSDTAKGRIEGVKKSFEIAVHKPLFGHGIGTNGEATWNVRRWTVISHILYGEVAIEIGFIGLLIFLVFMKNIITGFAESQKALKEKMPGNNFLMAMNNSMQVLLLMNIAFSFASYCLSGYAWYLLAGLSVVMRNLTEANESTEAVRHIKHVSTLPLQNYNY